MHKPFVLLISLFGWTCVNRSEIVKTENVSIISVSFNDSSMTKHRIIDADDSVKMILARLNQAHREPLKFYPRYRLNVEYKDGQQVLILCDGEAVKINGSTYLLQRSLNDLIK